MIKLAKLTKTALRAAGDASVSDLVRAATYQKIISLPDIESFLEKHLPEMSKASVLNFMKYSEGAGPKNQFAVYKAAAKYDGDTAQQFAGRRKSVGKYGPVAKEKHEAAANDATMSRAERIDLFEKYCKVAAELKVPTKEQQEFVKNKIRRSSLNETMDIVNYIEAADQNIQLSVYQAAVLRRDMPATTSIELAEKYFEVASTLKTPALDQQIFSMMMAKRLKQKVQEAGSSEDDISAIKTYIGKLENNATVETDSPSPSPDITPDVTSEMQGRSSISAADEPTPTSVVATIENPLKRESGESLTNEPPLKRAKRATQLQGAGQQPRRSQRLADLKAAKKETSGQQPPQRGR